MKGKKHKPETIEKMRLARLERKKRLGYLNSPETRKKISENNKGYIAWNKNRKGKFLNQNIEGLKLGWGWNKGKKLGFIPKMAFKKGQIPWNKGKKGLQVTWNKDIPMKEESKRKLSESKKGKLSHFKGKKRPELSGENHPMFGKHHLEKTKKKLKLINKGKHYSVKTEFKKGIKVWNKDKKGIMPPAWNKGKHTDYMKGEKHWNWKGGSTPKNIIIRMSLEYKLWRKAVFERDNYTCQICRKRGGILNADHIKPFAYFPELRFKLSNGRTLCQDCHKRTDSYLINKYRNQKGRYTTEEEM